MDQHEKQPEYIPPPLFTDGTKGALIGLVTIIPLIIAGNKIVNNYDKHVTENKEQPYCEFPVLPNEGLIGVNHRVMEAGDKLHSSVKVKTSHGLQALEVQNTLPIGKVVVEHVDTDACQKLNGESNFTYKQLLEMKMAPDLIPITHDSTSTTTIK